MAHLSGLRSTGEGGYDDDAWRLVLFGSGPMSRSEVLCPFHRRSDTAAVYKPGAIIAPSVRVGGWGSRLRIFGTGD